MLNGSGKILQKYFHTTPRGAIEFLIIGVVLLFGDPTKVSLIVGLIMSLLGEILRIWAAGYGYKLGEFSLRGPYRFVRHPYFLGSVLLFLGACVAGRDPLVVALALLVLGLVYKRAVRHDEAVQERVLGPEFKEYRDLVPAFVPQLLPFQPRSEAAQNKRFSLTYAVLIGRHRELEALILLAAGYALLYFNGTVANKEILRAIILVMVVLYLGLRFIYYKFARRPQRLATR